MKFTDKNNEEKPMPPSGLGSVVYDPHASPTGHALSSRIASNVEIEPMKRQRFFGEGCKMNEEWLKQLEIFNRQIATLAHIKKLAEDEATRLHNEYRKDRYKHWKIKESSVAPYAAIYQGLNASQKETVKWYHRSDLKDIWHSWRVTVILETDPLPKAAWMNEEVYSIAFKPEEGWSVEWVPPIG